MDRSQFESVLAEFGEVVKQEIVLDDDGSTTITIDEDVIINLQYLEESNFIVAFAPVGGFGGYDAPDAGEKALELLRLNKVCGATEGFTLALDREADLVLAMDYRSVHEFAYADAAASWIGCLILGVRAVREAFAEKFPVEEE